jgi:MFS family permease
VAVSLSLIASGWFSAFWLLLVARLVAGVGAGLLFIGGVAVVLPLDASHRSDLPVGVYYAGPGIGIAVSGMVVPWLLGALGWEWRAVWVALGALGLLAQLLVEPPLGRAERATQLPASATTPRPRLVLHDYLRLWPGLLAYALFGLGYIGYMTFVIAFLRASTVASIVVQGFWVLLGVCAALCGFTWRPVLRILAPHHALCCILLALSVGTGLPVLVSEPWSFALSAVLFGSSFLAVVTAITAQVRRTLPTERWTVVMGNATALFALGQLIGPTLTGIIADTPGGLALGLRASAVLLGVAAAIGLIKPLSEAADVERKA